MLEVGIRGDGWGGMRLEGGWSVRLGYGFVEGAPQIVRPAISDALGAGLAPHDGLARETQQGGKPGLREAELLAVLAILDLGSCQGRHLGIHHADS